MPSDLQNLLVILNGQKLNAGYLQPSGTGTALETVITMRQQFSPFVLRSNPLPGMTNVPQPNFLLSPARVRLTPSGQMGIYLDGVDGQLDFSQGQPAFTFLLP